MELVAWDVALGLAERGHNVKVITTARPEGGSCIIPAVLSDHLTIEHLDDTRPGRYSMSWWRAIRAAYNRERKKHDIVFSISVGALAVQAIWCAVFWGGFFLAAPASREMLQLFMGKLVALKGRV